MKRYALKTYLLSPVIFSMLANLAHAAETAPGNPAPTVKNGAATGALASGIDTQYIDPAVRIQDDFFKHMNGKWLKDVPIPADRSRWGSFDKLREEVQPQLRAIIEKAAQDATKAPGSDAQKIGDYYNSFMDEKKLDQLGVQPIQAELAKVRALHDKKQIPALIAYFSKIGVNTPYNFGITQDAKDSTKYAVDIGQGGLSLPDRDYYLKNDDPKLVAVRAKYVQHIEKMLRLAGHPNPAASAKQIVALETELAKVQWTNVENRDPVKTYNKIEIAQLSKLAPGYDWKSFLDTSGIADKVQYVIIDQPSYITGFNAVLKKAPLTAWKAYFEWSLINYLGNFLSKPFVDANFAFYGGVVSGVQENQPRWKRGVSLVAGALGEPLGKIYVADHFPSERKARMDTLVKNLLATYQQSIDTLDWMSPATKQQAQAKLAKITTKIGYPNKWTDYTPLQIRAGDLMGNLIRTTSFTYQHELNKLGKPINHDEWNMTPQTVNAYYSAEMNEIVFPAAMLQPPFFNVDADDAVNYGAIGAVIGHEISHGFDDRGSQFDGDGNLHDWWTKEDRKNFADKSKMLIAQYNAFSPVPGYHVNGALTLGENIADNSGMAIAFKAYQLSLGGKPAPIIDGATGDQRFYMGFAQAFRGKESKEEAISRVKTDPHSPREFRINGTMRNQPGFYSAFDVKEGDKMYLPPNQRVIMW
jgi:predicted metalloendopeptidase